MDDKPLTDSQQKKNQAVEDEKFKKIPTTKTGMGDEILPTLEDIKKGFKKFGDKTKEFGGEIIDKIFPKEPTPIKKAKGGLVTRADGAAKRGKTKGRTV